MACVLVVKMISLLNSLIVAVELYYKAYQTRQRRIAEIVCGSSHQFITIQRLLIVSKRRKDRRFWERPGKIAVWWDNFKNVFVSPEK